MKKIRIASGALALSVSCVSYAAAMPLSIAPEVIVTATRIPQYQTQSLKPATVITASQIAEAGQQTLVEVLQSLGGVEIASNGGFGQPSSVFIRGAGSGHTLVLIDGMRVSSATTGTTAFENIPVNEIDRIEVVPGPLSGLYGSDAIGGVIQIFTKSGKTGTSKSVSVGYGRYDTRNVSAGISTVKNDTDFNLNAGYLESRGFDATQPTIPFGQHNPDRDGYRNTNFSGRIAHHFGEDHELGMTLFRSDGQTHFDAGPTTDDVNHQTLTSYSIYSRNRLTERWQSLVRLGQNEDSITTRGAFPSNFRTKQPQLIWQNDVKLGYGTAVAGIEYLEQRVDSDSTYAATSRTNRAVFAGYSGEYEHHLWQVNVRDDRNSQFGNHQTGTIGYGYRITRAWKVRANAGTGFKAPTFNDLYLTLPPFYFGNPNLRPERSHSREIGTDVSIAGQSFSFTHFENHIADLVTVITDPNTFVSTTQNVNQARIRGNELAYHGEWLGFRATAHVTFQDPIDDATGKLLQRRARKHADASITKALGAWRLGSEFVASGARFDSATEDPTTRMHGYGLVNLIANYAIDREWEIRARWNNVTNTHYELAQYFNTPGSNLFVAVQYRPH